MATSRFVGIELGRVKRELQAPKNIHEVHPHRFRGREGFAAEGQKRPHFASQTAEPKHGIILAAAFVMVPEQ